MYANLQNLPMEDYRLLHDALEFYLENHPAMQSRSARKAKLEELLVNAQAAEDEVQVDAFQEALNKLNGRMERADWLLNVFDCYGAGLETTGKLPTEEEDAEGEETNLIRVYGGFEPYVPSAQEFDLLESNEPRGFDRLTPEDRARLEAMGEM